MSDHESPSAGSAYARHSRRRSLHTPENWDEEALFRPARAHAQRMQGISQDNAPIDLTNDSDAESLHSLRGLHISPEQAEDMPGISAQNAVAHWLNAVDSNHLDTADEDDEPSMYGHNVGLDLIPHMGFNPVSSYYAYALYMQTQC